jgi:hypothetical protein
MQTRRVNFWKRLKEVSMFFQGRDEVHKTLRRLIKRLKKANIPYAVMGGMAVYAHGHRRPTGDVDILLTEEGFAQFKDQFVPKNYSTVPKRPKRFTDKTNDISLDILITGLYPGSGKPGPLAFPDPEEVAETINDVQFVDLVTLIQLKLAARRHQDFADVVNLIRAKDLDESFADRLHPSLRADYTECLEEKLREDEYEARGGEPPPDS